MRLRWIRFKNIRLDSSVNVLAFGWRLTGGIVRRFK